MLLLIICQFQQNNMNVSNQNKNRWNLIPFIKPLLIRRFLPALGRLGDNSQLRLQVVILLALGYARQHLILH